MKATSELEKILDIRYIHGSVAYLKNRVENYVCSPKFIFIMTELQMQFYWPGNVFLHIVNKNILHVIHLMVSSKQNALPEAFKDPECNGKSTAWVG